MVKKTNKHKWLYSLSCLSLLVWLGWVAPGAAIASEAGSLTLSAALTRAYSSNPELAAATARAQSERAAVPSMYAPENPTVGFMSQKGLTGPESANMPMSSISVSQRILFPSKYFVRGSEQSKRADAADKRTQEIRLQVRQRVLTAYYRLFSTQRSLSLLDAQKETLRQMARIAEVRHSTGSVPQQDEMKAHVELTRIENEILLMQEKERTAQADLNALLNRPADEAVALPSGELKAPKLTRSLSDLDRIAIKNSPRVQTSQAEVKVAEKAKTLANLSYAPDFLLGYRKGISGAQPGNYAAEVDMSIPLWFFANQKSQVSAAGAKLEAADKDLLSTRRNVESRMSSLLTEVKSHRKILEIYSTALIPQASTTLSSSTSAYRAGRTSMVDLLDSERALYETEISYYRRLAEYVASISELEAQAGESLSTLPFGEKL